jgi:hypothetical protein
VAVFQIGRERETATVDDRGVVLLVKDYVVLAPGEGGEYSQVGAESCGI